MPLGASFFEDVPLATSTPRGVIVGDSGLCCCVACVCRLLMFQFTGHRAEFRNVSRKGFIFSRQQTSSTK